MAPNVYPRCQRSTHAPDCPVMARRVEQAQLDRDEMWALIVGIVMVCVR